MHRFALSPFTQSAQSTSVTDSAYYAGGVYIGKRNVTSASPSVCPVFFLTLIERAAHTQRDSPGGSM